MVPEVIPAAVIESRDEFGPVDVVRLAESFVAKGMMIRQLEALAATLTRVLEMAGPVVLGIPVDYRDNHRLIEIVHSGALN